jgi:hypothetical protein
MWSLVLHFSILIYHFSSSNRSAPRPLHRYPIHMSFPTIFCLASGRSGTHFLYEILRRNTRDTVRRHEPYLWNPSMFGRPIYDRAVGDDDALRRVALKKRRVIENYTRTAAYAETSHAFLKSWSDQAIEFWPRMKLVHLVRNPLAVAKSEAAREEIMHRWRIPFRNYRGGDGQSYFRWALTGLEPIFGYAPAPLTRYQHYLLQWIEIENRAMRFLQQHGKAADCFTLHSPADLNSLERVQSLLEFLDLPRRSSEVILQGSQNRTPGVRTRIEPKDEQTLAEVIAWLPPEFLSIFGQPPYDAWEWSKRLIRK